MATRESKLVAYNHEHQLFSHMDCYCFRWFVQWLGYRNIVYKYQVEYQLIYGSEVVWDLR